MKSAIWKKLLLSLLSASLAIIACELGLRILAPQPQSWLDIYMSHPKLPFYCVQPNIYRKVSDGETTWEIYTDESGFRVGPHPRPLVQENLILLLGDSFCFGNGVNYEETFAGRLEADASVGWSVVNTGVGGWGPVQYHTLLKDLLDSKYDPRLVLVQMYTGNDFYDVLWNKDIPVNNGILGDKQDFKSTVQKRSHLYRLLAITYHRCVKTRHNYHSLREQMFSPTNWEHGVLEEGYALFCREFEKISHVCHLRSIPLLVCIIPTRAEVEGLNHIDHQSTRMTQLPLKKAKELFDHLQIHYIDMTPVLAESGADNTFLVHDGHLNANGHQLVATAIQRKLKKNFGEMPVHSATDLSNGGI